MLKKKVWFRPVCMHTQICVSMQVCMQMYVCAFMWRSDDNLGLSFLKGCPLI